MYAASSNIRRLLTPYPNRAHPSDDKHSPPQRGGALATSAINLGEPLGSFEDGIPADFYAKESAPEAQLEQMIITADKLHQDVQERHVPSDMEYPVLLPNGNKAYAGASAKDLKYGQRIRLFHDGNMVGYAQPAALSDPIVRQKKNGTYQVIGRMVFKEATDGGVPFLKAKGYLPEEGCEDFFDPYDLYKGDTAALLVREDGSLVIPMREKTPVDASPPTGEDPPAAAPSSLSSLTDLLARVNLRHPMDDRDVVVSLQGAVPEEPSAPPAVEPRSCAPSPLTFNQRLAIAGAFTGVGVVSLFLGLYFGLTQRTVRYSIGYGADVEQEVRHTLYRCLEEVGVEPDLYLDYLNELSRIFADNFASLEAYPDLEPLLECHPVNMSLTESQRLMAVGADIEDQLHKLRADLLHNAAAGAVALRGDRFTQACLMAFAVLSLLAQWGMI